MKYKYWLTGAANKGRGLRGAIDLIGDLLQSLCLLLHGVSLCPAIIQPPGEYLLATQVLFRSLQCLLAKSEGATIASVDTWGCPRLETKAHRIPWQTWPTSCAGNRGNRFSWQTRSFSSHSEMLSRLLKERLKILFKPFVKQTCHWRFK